MIRTEPASGESLEEGKTLTLVISQGPSLAELPDLNGKTLQEAVDLLSRESTAILNQAEAAERIRAVFQQPMILTPEQLGALVRKSAEDWAVVIKAADLKVQ